MQRLGQALGGAVSRSIGGKQRGLWALTRRWPDLVGLPLAMRSLPVRISEKGVLWVRVQSSSTAQELALLKSSLVPQLAQYGVTSLRTRVSTWAATTLEDLLRDRAADVQEMTGESLKTAYRKKALAQRAERGVRGSEAGSYNDPEGGDGAAPMAPGDLAQRLQAAFEAKKAPAAPPKETT